MRLLFLIYFLAASSLVNQCDSRKTSNLDKFMQSSWQTSYIKITMPTHTGTDTMFIFEDSFKSANSIKAQSIYLANHTFEAWYLSSEGEQLNKTSGQWNTKGLDTLILSYTYNDRIVEVNYFIQPEKDGFLGRSIHDWDNDGIKDDTLIMKSKRIQLPKSES